MQLESFNNQEEGISETQPILQQPAHALGSKVSISSFEIRAVHAIYLDGEDSQRFDDEEHCNLVNDDRPQCRICLDIGGEDFIAPCLCRGTQKYVHRSCLDHWRSTKEGRAFSHCTKCKAVFILRANVPPDRRWLRLKFKLLVVRDLAFIFVIVQLFVVFLGAVVYKFYGDELREMFGYEEHPFGFYAIAVLAIILVGLLYGFFMAIICG